MENRLRFDLNSHEIAELLSKLLEEAKQRIENIINIPQSERTFENTVRSLDLCLGYLENGACQCTFPSLVSTDKTIRDVATQSKKRLEEFEIETFSNEKLYLSFVEYKEKREPLNNEQQRLLNKFLEDFERNGLALSPQNRKRYIELRKQITKLCIEFNRNVNEIDIKVPFSEEELDGLPKDFIENLPKDPTNNKRLVSLKYPELFPVLEMANNEETRKVLDTIYGQQCVDTNIPILKEILRLRYEAAVLIGFDSDASFVLQTKMAKKIETVKHFLEDLSERLTPLFEKEFSWMCELKREQYIKMGKQTEDKITLQNWDIRYYQRMILERFFQVDDEVLRTYFPIEKVINGMFDVYQQILGVKFVKDEKAPLWHEDVQCFSVFDKETNELKGQFYLDLWPRSGKYSHAACFPLQVAFTDERGQRHHAVSAMVTNFTKPTSQKPSLLKFKEVTTLFHEFGHVMHSILANSTFNRLNWRWNAVEQDFLESPSMMFENWCYEEEVLTKISSHYRNGEVMPKELQKNLVKSRIANLGFLFRRLIFMSLFDLTIHSTNGQMDIEKIWTELKIKHIKVPPTPQTVPFATWQHLTTGYNAGYYGYLWSEVISKDLYSRFQREGVLNSAVGSELRRYILEPCAMKDACEMLRDFLKRDFNSESFFRSLHLT